MLWEPAAHEPLEGVWDETRARASIRAIVADAERAFDPDRLWTVHPGDVYGPDQSPAKALWAGACGVVWALRDLGSEARDWDAVAARLHGLYLAEPDTEEVVPGLWAGEAGILLVAGQADPLLDAVRRNASNETNELMWGAPGTMLAARFLHERTGEERWAQAWRESAERLWDAWEDDGLWTQELYGQTSRYVGPAHGWAGNVMALAYDLLPAERRAELERRAVETATRLAVREDGLANWPPRAVGGLASAGDGSIRTQWCHGAPGIVCSLAELAPGDDELTELLVAGGELTWRAGPLAKGPGLCHGSAGNGYAFLRLLGRTGDERWLERARAFAAHALVQAEHGQGRYSLWTGDVGAALYARDCLEARAAVPTIDYI